MNTMMDTAIDTAIDTAMDVSVVAMDDAAADAMEVGVDFDEEFATRARDFLVDLHGEYEQLEVGCTFTLSTTAPVTTFLRIRPCEHVTFGEDLDLLATCGPVESTTATEGVPASDEKQFVELTTLPAGESLVRYSAFLDVSPVADPMPDDVTAPSLDRLRPEEWWWLQPTRYIRPDELGEEAWNRFGRAVAPTRPATGALVREICTYVNENMSFEYGSSSAMTSATDAWAARRGVCRDFNHVAVSFCRALNIPARYVFGYIPDIGVRTNDAPMDFCAWFEVLMDGRWWTFDARVNEPRIGRVVVGRGRDAADVPLVSTLGPAVLSEFEVTARRSNHVAETPAIR